METCYYKSPIGILEISYIEDALVSIKLAEKIKSLSKENAFAKNVKVQLDEYFSGKRKKFRVNIKPEGSEFQKRVWNELINIPYGKTASYSEIAKNIGNANAQRAVGSACNKNPVMIIIPCHRVISKNGNIGREEREPFISGFSANFSTLP